MSETKSIRQQVALIHEAFDALAGVCQNGFIDERNRLFKICLEEEKEHRQFNGGTFREFHTSDSIGASDVAKMFVVNDLASFLLGTRALPELKDYLHVKKSHFHAGAMVLEFRKEIAQAWLENQVNIEELAQLNYTQLVKVKRSKGEQVAA